jgi:hypothetical protein
MFNAVMEQDPFQIQGALPGSRSCFPEDHPSPNTSHIHPPPRNVHTNRSHAPPAQHPKTNLGPAVQIPPHSTHPIEKCTRLITPSRWLGLPSAWHNPPLHFMGSTFRQIARKACRVVVRNTRRRQQPNHLGLQRPARMATSRDSRLPMSWRLTAAQRAATTLCRSTPPWRLSHISNASGMDAATRLRPHHE